MGFLERLGFSRKKEPALVELRLSEVKPFVEKKASEKKFVLEKEVPSKFSEIKHLIGETQGYLKELEKAEISESGNKRFRKAAKTAKKDSVKRIKGVLQKLEPPFSTEPAKVRDYCFESLSLLREKIRSSAKSIAYTSVLLKDLMKQVGERIDAIESVLKSLVGTIKENSILFEQSDLLGLVSGIERDSEELKKARASLAELKKSLETAREERKRLESELEKALGSEEAVELRALEERKNKLLEEKTRMREKLVNRVSGLNRPLKKLKNLSLKKEFFLSGESQKALALFFEGEEKPFKQDPKGNSFKALLKELKGAIVSERIELGEKERAKRLDEIDSLLSADFFSDYFWKGNEIGKQLNAVEARKKSLSSNSKVGGLKRALEETGHGLKQAENAVESTQRKIILLGNKINSSAETLSAKLSELTSEKIKIEPEK